MYWLVVSWYNHSHPLMLWCQFRCTHDKTHIHTRRQYCCIETSHCMSPLNKYFPCWLPLCYCSWLNGPHNIYLTARNCYWTLLKAMGCFAKSCLGEICFQCEQMGYKDANSNHKDFQFTALYWQKGLPIQKDEAHLHFIHFLHRKLSSKLEVFQLGFIQCSV